MHTYKITIVFVNNLQNLITYIDSNLTLNHFVEQFNKKFQDKTSSYYSFIGEEPMIMINKDNVVYYKVEKEK